MGGMGRTPHPQAAALATGSALSLTEYAKADTQQRDTDEHQQNGVSGHHIPHITDNGFDRAHIAITVVDQALKLLGEVVTNLLVYYFYQLVRKTN